MGLVGKTRRNEPAPDLVASCWTLAGGAFPHTDREYSRFDFRARVEAGARVGFRGIGIWHADLIHYRRRFQPASGVVSDTAHPQLVFFVVEFKAPLISDGERRLFICLSHSHEIIGSGT